MAEYRLSMDADDINQVLLSATTKPDGATVHNFPVFSESRELADSGKNTNSFAAALVTTDGPGKNVEIYPDAGTKISVTSHGKTNQSGSGDPSPTNIRPITFGGVWDNLFDPSLLIPSFRYDPSANIVSFEAFGTESDTQYDWFNGTFGTSAVAEKYIQLNPNTRYEVTIDNLTGSGVYFYTVDAAGKTSVDSRLYFASGKNLRGFITTTETGKLTVRSTYANKGSVVSNLKISENWFDTSLLYEGVSYDRATNTVSPPVVSESETYYDIFNGTTGASALAEKYILLKPNTKYKLSCGKIIGASIYVFRVASDGKAYQSQAASSVGEDGRYQIFETTSNDRITLRVYSVKSQTSYSDIRISEFSEDEFKTIISSVGNEQYNIVSNLQKPLLNTDSFSTAKNEGGNYVSEEKHNWTLITFKGDETWSIDSPDQYPNLLRFKLDFVVADTNDMISSHGVRKTSGAIAGAFYIVTGGSSLYVNPTGGQWGDILSGWSPENLVDKWKEWTKKQYESGAPLQVAIRRSVPQIFKKSAVMVNNIADDSGKITISGSDSVSVTYNKSIARAISELQAAIIALGAKHQGGM